MPRLGADRTKKSASGGASPWRKYLKVQADGLVDVEVLSEISPELLASWLEQHLDGNDPYVALNNHDLESPGAILRDLWQRGGAGLRTTLANAGRILLARFASSQSEPSRALLLEFIRDVAPPELRPDVVPSVAQLAALDSLTPIQLRQLRAAASYALDPGSRAAWEKLVVRPETTAIAFRALMWTPGAAMPYVETYWNNANGGEREYLFPQLLEDLAKTDPQGFRDLARTCKNESLRKQLETVVPHQVLPPLTAQRRSETLLGFEPVVRPVAQLACYQ